MTILYHAHPETGRYLNGRDTEAIENPMFFS